LLHYLSLVSFLLIFFFFYFPGVGRSRWGVWMFGPIGRRGWG